MSEEEKVKRFGPQLEYGHRVIVGKNRAQLNQTQHVATGIVVGLGDETCDIWSVQSRKGQGKVWLGCRYADDPQLDTHPDWFDNDNFGVYRLTKPEQALQTLGEDVAKLQEIVRIQEPFGGDRSGAVEQLAGSLKVLIEQVEQLQTVQRQQGMQLESMNVKRGPGRPRKQPVGAE